MVYLEGLLDLSLIDILAFGNVDLDYLYKFEVYQLEGYMTLFFIFLFRLDTLCKVTWSVQYILDTCGTKCSNMCATSDPCQYIMMGIVLSVFSNCDLIKFVAIF